MGQIGRADRARVTDWFLASSCSRTGGVSLAIVPSINITRVTPVAEVCRAVYEPRSICLASNLGIDFQIPSQSRFFSNARDISLDELSFRRISRLKRQGSSMFNSSFLSNCRRTVIIRSAISQLSDCEAGFENLSSHLLSRRKICIPFSPAFSPFSPFSIGK